MSDSGGYEDCDKDYDEGEYDNQLDYLSDPEDEFFDQAEPVLKPPSGRVAKEPGGSMGYLDFKYTCIGPDELMSRMHDIVRQVNAIFELPACTTRILLSHFNWDKERLLERFYDGNQEKLFSEAHIVNPFRKAWGRAGSAQGAAVTPFMSSDIICDICLMDTAHNQLEGLECQHLFCVDCWRSYLRTRIEDSGDALAIPCPERRCDILVNEDIVYRVMQPYPEVIEYTLLFMCVCDSSRE